MRCFNLDDNGDVEIKNNKIVMTTSENELIRQKIQKVLSTNKNEWFSDAKEGINFQNILKKGVTEEDVKSELIDGLTQIDPSFIMTEFGMEIDDLNRALYVSFTATNDEGDTVETNIIY